MWLSNFDFILFFDLMSFSICSILAFNIFNFYVALIMMCDFLIFTLSYTLILSNAIKLTVLFSYMASFAFNLFSQAHHLTILQNWTLKWSWKRWSRKPITPKVVGHQKNFKILIGCRSRDQILKKFASDLVGPPPPPIE